MNRIHQLLVNRTDNSFVQFFRYGLVSGVALVVDFGSLVFFTEIFHLHYLVSATLGFTLGLITNYLLSILWVFEKSKYTFWREFITFCLIGVVGLGINNGIMLLFTGTFGVYYVYSKVVATGFTFIWNFTARKLILFNSKDSKNAIKE